ncbi:MAG: alcohol dehydrogenase [Oceanospirillaceae bacterium]|jgi:alcohol dehydrogenase|uniref:iron-containing alcohol dehydrogenase n=1 Tax=unclassified Thalassolituus TaxID=2624967 RepID=UPI000C112DB3|nr:MULTISPECIES: iron-containing alcohol dehydrogenase [unclassified Thalassolituus]MAE34573.1 alcohol dehydrogenase [Oceanospirillaceae bacterium]MBN57701.1 alcohol dehydrogenase [Oceanospirillaceae bacterium]MDQ4424022.1 iron-containing alcohol dehydrogenase [Thalassolituus sp.]MDQ4426130.1 iron-containing alcohol dehydrogenase [Thalassolituus sp.]|tara:strand:- start:3343 stop:4512 length:1170 start_codon:yes stop_codon:yes gene_type:complete
MTAFTFTTTRTIINEPGSARRLAAICEEQGARSVMLVTDPGIINVGLLEDVLPAFKESGIQLTLFKDVEADPADSTVTDAANQARAAKADYVVGFGGGSSMDVAKLVALLAHSECKQPLSDMYGVGNARGKRLPLLQVPTTAGTGSEVTPIAIVTTGATTKAGVVSPVLQPDIALLDAELTKGLPAHVTAATGIDAMVHAIEAYTSVHKKNPVSDMLAKEALRLLSSNLMAAVNEGHNLEARSNMLLGALYAGQAFANAPVAAVHALAYPLGGHFHIPHGLSNSLVLPHVMRFNAANDTAAAQYAELAPYIMGLDAPEGSPAQITDALITWLEQRIKETGLPMTLRECDIPEDAIPMLASEAMLQQRLLINNPREVSEADALAIYTAAY